MKPPLVSVVIATYNMQQFLPHAMRSVLDQSYPNLELIVIDDGSSDDTALVVEPFLSDDRVNYVKQENLGQPKAKNHGLRLAKGEFVAFCDADDLWIKDKLKLQIPLFDDPEVGVVYSEVSYMNEKGRRYDKPAPYVRHQGRVTQQMLIKNFVPFGTAVFRSSCLKRNGVFDEQFKMGIDWDLWLRYSLDWKFAYLPEKTYIYREWSGQMSTDYRGRYDHAFAILAKFEAQFGGRVPDSFLKKAWADNYISRGWMFAVKEGKVIDPVKDVVKGLIRDPLNFAGWKILIKILLRRYR